MTYFSERDDLHSLDMLALAILLEAGDKMLEAGSFSSRDETFGIPAKRESGQIYNRCVALARTEGTLYVAVNGLWSSKELARHAQGRFYKSVAKNIQQAKPLDEKRSGVKSFQDEIATALRAQSGVAQVVFMDGASKHAEMQLVSYFISNGVTPKPPYVGVSKPCCPECQAVLESAGLQYTSKHAMATRGDGALAFVRKYAQDTATTGLHPHLDADRLAAFKSRPVG